MLDNSQQVMFLDKFNHNFLPCMRQAPGDEGVLLLVGGVALGLLALRAPAHAPAVVEVDPSYSPA